ncbi:MAG: hypothetical protein EB053_02460 [Chlamydiae bacterium]|nr:hypothetical protein [Chlamydiota bacterium]
MWFRLFAVLIFLMPWIFCPHTEDVLFVSTCCPACVHKILQLQNRDCFPRLWVLNRSIEVNCLMGKVYQIAPQKQLLFLEFIRKNSEKLPLSDFYESSQIDKAQLLPCKNCMFYELSVNEIQYYVMSIFISTIPYGAEKSTKHPIPK